MKLFRLLSLALGLGLFGFLLAQADLGAVVYHVGRLGWAGALAIPAVSMLPFFFDTWSWHMLLTPARPGLGWFADLWKIRAVGSAVSKITPVVGAAGEPVKAMMLKRLYGIPYGEGIASLVLAKTANMLALVVFVAIGVALALTDDLLPASYKLVVAAGFAALALSIGGFFALQRLRLSSAFGIWLSRGPLGPRIEGLLHHLHDMDDRLTRTYTSDRARFLAATFLTFLNWILVAAELYLIFWFMNRPVGVAEAIVITVTLELARVGTFFIPLSIGAEEATLAVVVTSITGEAGLGLAVAFVRRYRELLWIALGILLAWQMTGRSQAPMGALLRASEYDRPLR